MNEGFIRQVIVFQHHFWDFYNTQTLEVQKKIDWIIGLLRTLQVIPVKFFKHLEGSDGLYEMRIKVGSDIYRVFCCLDKGNIVILFNGFQKKSEKTPKQELERALKIKQQYHESKKS